MELLRKLSTRFALHRAKQLIQAGKQRDALQYLSNANRKRNNVLIEREIVDLLLQIEPDERQSKGVAKARSGGSPPELDMQAGSIPEIEAKAFNADVLRDAIDRNGYLIVRGYFGSQDSSTLRTCIDESLRARVQAEQAQALNEDSPWYYPSPHFPGSHGAWSKRNTKKKFDVTGSMMVIDSPRGTRSVLDMYKDIGVKGILDDYFGEAAVLSTRKWVFRLVPPRVVGHPIGGGWHQDGRFMGEGIRALNMWVALSECGDGSPAPGISLLPKRFECILETGTRGANLNWTVGIELIEELAKETNVVSPHFNAGDALFFDHYSLHRSGNLDGQTQNRYALESWFYAGSARADNAVIELT